MNENIDLRKILNGCPEGTKFYHSIYGEVSFLRIENSGYPIRFVTSENTEKGVTSKGIYNGRYGGECIFFPSKEQRDWSKFERFLDKPKVEKFDVNTLHPFDKVLTRCDNSEKWDIDLFGYFDNLYKGVCCLDAYLQMCIPYNDETKHLVGTKNDCPDYYKWWEE